MDVTFNFRQLTNEEITNIYNTYMVKDFHSNELKPLKNMFEYLEAGFYMPYGMFWNDELLAYGFMFKDNNVALLDYYAVVEKYRGRGIGSKFISYLYDRLDLFICEVENPDFALDENDLIIRKKRRLFYGKNKLVMSGLKVLLFGTHYNIWYYAKGREYSDESLLKEVNNIYFKMFNKDKYEKNVFLTRE